MKIGALITFADDIDMETARLMMEAANVVLDGSPDENGDELKLGSDPIETMILQEFDPAISSPVWFCP